jgi:N-acetylmuramoyl-L-alanine amidase
MLVMEILVQKNIELLKKQGYTVYRNNPDEKLSEAVKKSNEVNPDIHVSIHSNASGQGYNAQGPEIFANRANTAGDRLANAIYDEIIEIYPDPSKGRGVLYTSSLYEIIRTNAPAVLLEVAFHDNKDDANWIINNEDEIAQAIVNGINNYFSKT